MKFKNGDQVVFAFCKNTSGDFRVYVSPGQVTDFSDYGVVRDFDTVDKNYKLWVDKFGTCIWTHESYVFDLSYDTYLKDKNSSSGLFCFECKYEFQYAEPNFGDKLVCWSCRDSMQYKYSFKNGVVTLK